MERCLQQIFRPENPIKGFNDWGDCLECIPDEDNKNCNGYQLINIQVFEVEEEEE